MEYQILEFYTLSFPNDYEFLKHKQCISNPQGMTFSQ